MHALDKYIVSKKKMDNWLVNKRDKEREKVEKKKPLLGERSATLTPLHALCPAYKATCKKTPLVQTTEAIKTKLYFSFSGTHTHTHTHTHTPSFFHIHLSSH
jgi:hypothetical protein